MTLYEILGVERGANPDEIKVAYRSLAQRYHPDKEGGDEEKFKQIQHAYEVLSDWKRAEEYDATGIDNHTPGDALHAQAVFELSQLLDATMDRVSDVVYTDIVKVIREAINAKMNDFKQHKKNYARRIEKNNKALGRVKVAEGKEDLLSAGLKRSNVHCQNQIADFQSKEDLGKKMLELLEDYNYTTDKRQPEMNPFAQTAPFTGYVTGIWDIKA